MEYILSFLTILADTISVIFICDALMKRISRPLVFWTVIIAQISFSFVLFDFVLTGLRAAPFKLVVVLLLYFIMLVLDYKGSVLKSFFAAALSLVFIMVIEAIMLSGLMLVLRVSQEELLMNPAYWLLGAFITRITLVTLSYSFRRIRTDQNKAGDIGIWNWIRILVVPVITVASLSTAINSMIERDAVGSWVFVEALGLLIVNIVVLFLVDKVEQEQQIQNENILLQQEVKNRMESATALMTAYETQRKLTHDFNNHINTLGGLIADNHIEQAKQYIADLAHEAQAVLVVDTNNPIINAVLNQKYALAKQQGISMRFKVNDLSCLNIKNADLVTVLANLLDNAITACHEVQKQPSIVVKILSDDSKTLLSVRNTSNPVLIEDNSIRTSKSDAMQHGFGLQNIKRVLESYSFEYTLTYSNGWFQFTTIL